MSGSSLHLGAIVCCVLASLSVATPVVAETRMSVNGEGGVRRTCPSFDCGMVGRFFPGESVVVYEKVDGWSRVSNYYSAACYAGHSSFVESGRDACAPDNGIHGGEFAEWTRSDALVRPADDAAG